MLRNEDAVSASGMGNVNEGPGTDEEAVEDEASGGAAGRGIGESSFSLSGSVSGAGTGLGLLVSLRAGEAIIGSGEGDRLDLKLDRESLRSLARSREGIGDRERD